MIMYKRLYPYRDLLYVFIWREFGVRYRNSVLGILWSIIQPLSMMILITFIFTYIIKVKVGDYPKPIFFYSALLPWTFFSTSFSSSISSLAGSQGLITKIYFPREVLPISGICVAFLDLLIASTFYIVLLFYYNISLNLTILWIIPIFFLLFLFTLSVSLIFSSLNVYYKDVGLLSAFLLRLLFFGSPILYSIDSLSLKLKLLLFLNPLTFIIENTRRVILEGRNVVLWQFALAMILVLILFHLSYKLFIKIERNFADVI